MRPFLVFPDTQSPELGHALDAAGVSWQTIASPAEITTTRPDSGWGGAIVAVDRQGAAAWALCHVLAEGVDRVAPVILIIATSQLAELADRDELYDDFCIAPVVSTELEKRIKHAMWRAGGADDDSTLEYQGLAINAETYQAAIDGVAIELTHMEFELLKFLVSNPGRVFTREVLLSQVWGYDYFGGARTVDVHIRRLRSKLGEDRASLIQTVRSVGYSFGESGWNS